jgi:predicted hotdog family 3-hydroxylacyl-ACP dehydratase
MLLRNEFADLIPHSGTMCLIDRVVSWDEQTIISESDSHRSPDHPLRSQGRLHALHLAEYGAQAMAIHGALLARSRGGLARPGMLVSLRNVDLHIDYVDQLTGNLTITAHCDHADTASLQYTFKIEHEGTSLAEGRAAVVLRKEE